MLTEEYRGILDAPKKLSKREKSSNPLRLPVSLSFLVFSSPFLSSALLPLSFHSSLPSFFLHFISFVLLNGGDQRLGGRRKGETLTKGYKLSVISQLSAGTRAYRTVTTVNDDVYLTSATSAELKRLHHLKK